MMVKKNLLIIHQGALGDFVLTFPAFIQLRKYFNTIDVLCQSGLGKLAKALGLVENGHPLEAAHVASLYSDIFDPKITTLLLSYVQIILFSLSPELEQNIHQITSKRVCRIAPKPPFDVCKHVTEYVLENLTRCHLIKKMDAVLTDMPFPRRSIGPKDDKKILLHPGSGSPRKRWSISNFIEVEAMLKTDGLKPEFLLGPAELDLMGILPRKNRIVHSLTDLTELTALLNTAGGYIGTDSGASHLAAFLGVPSGVIFGPSDPKRWQPVGRAVVVVKREIGCRPCFETEAVNCEDSYCLEKITPKEVIKAFYRIYSA
jgi:ADP-heptose:LPS heptosyltransferase